MLFFDLDGTLLDIVERHCSLYSHLVTALGGIPLDREEYWHLKRQAIPNTEILARSLSPDSAEKFARNWMDEIESIEYLRKDSILPGIPELLENLGAKEPLALLTLRRSQSALDAQLEWLGLGRYFSRVLCTGSGDWKRKGEMLAGAKPDASCWLVGDGEADIQAARAAGVRCCAVSWGMRSAEYLDRLKPDALVSDLRQLPHILGRTARQE